MSDASGRQVVFDEVISADDPRFKVVMRLRMRQRKYESDYNPVMIDEDDE